MESFANRIIEAVHRYAREHPCATWESVADQMEAEADSRSGAWFEAHPESKLSALTEK